MIEGTKIEEQMIVGKTLYQQKKRGERVTEDLTNADLKKSGAHKNLTPFQQYTLSIPDKKLFSEDKAKSIDSRASSFFKSESQTSPNNSLITCL